MSEIKADTEFIVYVCACVQ